MRKYFRAVSLALRVARLLLADPSKWNGIVEQVLAGINPFHVVRFETWRTVEVGLVTCRNCLYQILSSCIVCEGAKKIIDKENFVLSKVKRNFNLVCLTVDDTDIDRPTVRFSEICDWAISKGLECCPTEVGPYFLTQYGMNLQEQIHLVIREDIIENTFVLGNNGKPYINTSFIQPGDIVSSSIKFIFVKP